MPDLNVYFFWPGWIISIVLSILLSILLTAGLNFRRRNQGSSDASPAGGSFYDSSIEPDPENDSRTKTGGMILIGPIPVVFGNGGLRFDKSVFKYALAFFLIVLFGWVLFARIVRL